MIIIMLLLESTNTTSKCLKSNYQFIILYVHFILYTLTVILMYRIFLILRNTNGYFKRQYE